eukprot:354486-Rhodomonas_salina.2
MWEKKKTAVTSARLSGESRDLDCSLSNKKDFASLRGSSTFRVKLPFNRDGPGTGKTHPKHALADSDHATVGRDIRA